MKFLLPPLLALFLGACTTLLPTTDPGEVSPPGGDAWREHADSVVSLEGWFLKGRLVIRTEQEGWNASLHWRQQDERFNLRVLAPLGQGSVELSGREGDTITLVTSDNERYSAPDAESLMERQLGWSMPVAGLNYWIRGLPARDGGITAAEPDDRGRIARLEQNGWVVEISEYTRALGRDLPRKLRISNDRFEVRLVIQSWETAAP